MIHLIIYLLIKHRTVMDGTRRVTAGAIVSTTKSRKEVVELSLAINDYYRPQGPSEAI